VGRVWPGAGVAVTEVPSVADDIAVRVAGAGAVEGNVTTNLSTDRIARIRLRRQIADSDGDDRDIRAGFSGVIGDSDDDRVKRVDSVRSILTASTLTIPKNAVPGIASRPASSKWPV